MKSREGSGQHDIYNLQFYNLWYRIQRRKEKFRDTAKENPRCQKSLSAEFCATGFYVAWEKQPTFRDAKTGFPTQWRCLRNERRNFKLVTCHGQIWVVLLIGRAAREICFNQSEALLISGYWHVISMEFLRSFRGETSVKVVNCGLFSQISVYAVHKMFQKRNTANVNVSSSRSSFQVSNLHWSLIARLCWDQLKIISHHLLNHTEVGQTIGLKRSSCVPASKCWSRREQTSYNPLLPL